MFDDQMIDASKDKRIVNLFTRGSHHRNLSVIYIEQNLFHQGKGSRNISIGFPPKNPVLYLPYLLIELFYIGMPVRRKGVRTLT